ncbi:hypothetical protein [Formosa haliotis]|uniref:hypothetical protein n=1 Tax=Formosa haliotis TaxID=1555194 RepID=UPI0008257AEC|nr:hypothetical protein [Formosa haliotis]
MTDIDIEEFGNKHRNKRFSEIVASTKMIEEKDAVTLFFVEMLNYGKALEDAELEFLKTSEKILEVILDNAKDIDNDLLLFLGRVNKGLKKH